MKTALNCESMNEARKATWEKLENFMNVNINPNIDYLASWKVSWLASLILLQFVTWTTFYYRKYSAKQHEIWVIIKYIKLFFFNFSHFNMQAERSRTRASFCAFILNLNFANNSAMYILTHSKKEHKNRKSLEASLRSLSTAKDSFMFSCSDDGEKHLEERKRLLNFLRTAFRFSLLVGHQQENKKESTTPQ